MSTEIPPYDHIDVNNLMFMAASAAQTIKDLRAENEQLKAKAQAYDQITILMRFMRGPAENRGEDIAWKLERQIERIRSSAVVAYAAKDRTRATKPTASDEQAGSADQPEPPLTPTG